jgi:hypothetical protein
MATVFTVERNQYTDVGSLFNDVIKDMLANGFTLIYPTSGTWTTPGSLTAFSATLEASGSVDPLNATGVQNKQPWRVHLEVTAAQTSFICVGTPIQLPADGSYARVTSDNGQITDTVGITGAPLGSGGNIMNANPAQGFINRSYRVGSASSTYPMTYRLSITNRGFFLGVWEDAVTESGGNHFNWILVQRPVDRDTGSIIVDGKSPVFSVNCVENQYWKYVVREADIMRPTSRIAADSNTPDSEACFNSVEQVSLTEDNKYVVTFPCRLNTPRYRYTHELDMIGITSSDVVSQFSDVPLTVYGQSTPRIYKALHANGLNNTGMRVLVITSDPN